MTTQHFESVAELALAYRSDLDDGHDDGWWAAAEYTADADHGTLRFRPRQAVAQAAGATRAAGTSAGPTGTATEATGSGSASEAPAHAAEETASGTPAGEQSGAAVSTGWSVSIDVLGGALERSFTGASLPAPAEAARQLEALARRAAPARHEERERVIGQLRELAAQRHKIDSEARRIALDAVARGVKKIAVADAARISRVTLDKWIRDHSGRD